MESPCQEQSGNPKAMKFRLLQYLMCVFVLKKY